MQKKLSQNIFPRTMPSAIILAFNITPHHEIHHQQNRDLLLTSLIFPRIKYGVLDLCAIVILPEELLLFFIPEVLHNYFSQLVPTTSLSPRTH